VEQAPVNGSQEPSEQASPWAQLTGEPAQVPPPQMSSWVQGSPSSQVAPSSAGSAPTTHVLDTQVALSQAAAPASAQSASVSQHSASGTLMQPSLGLQAS